MSKRSVVIHTAPNWLHHAIVSSGFYLNIYPAVSFFAGHQGF